MKSLVQFLFIIAISVGFLAPTALACKSKTQKTSSHRVGLSQKKSERKPASVKKSAKKANKKNRKHQSRKKHKASAGEIRARQYLSSTSK